MSDVLILRDSLELNPAFTQFNRQAYQLLRSSQTRYYRSGPNAPSSWLLRRPNIVTGGVIGLCVAGYTANLYAEDHARKTHDRRPLNFIRQNLVCSLENVNAGRWWVMATSSVMHMGPLHLGLNMWALWSVGPAVVSYFGTPQFVGLWLLPALSCSAASLYWTHYKEELRRDKSVGRRLDSQKRPQLTRYIDLSVGKNTEYYGGAIGASGSLFGLYAAIMCIVPRAPVHFIGLPMLSFPMWFSNAFFAAGSVYCMMTGAIPHISHSGHLGGMAGGIVYYLGVIRPFLGFRGRRF